MRKSTTNVYKEFLSVLSSQDIFNNNNNKINFLKDVLSNNQHPGHFVIKTKFIAKKRIRSTDML